MFKNLLKLLNNKTETPEDTAQELFACLLVRAARIDNEYSNSEKMQIDKILEDKFDVTQIRAAEIRMAGEKLESNTVDTVQITREIKKDVPFEHRKALAEDLWSIILADTKRTDDENSFMRTCIKLIGVNDVDSAKARHAVLNRNQSKN
ncbi:MAG: TerB family tellurite resistance protein [Paracoccaceae bacterium]|nr:TerB family tellurite resistance protein [Paracoccaceae bacterium]